MPPKGPPGRQQETESVLMKWLGHRVVVKYLAGPEEPMDPDDKKGIAHAALEARSGVFELHRIGQVGIEVSNSVEDAAEDRVTLLPWGAILSVRGSTPSERGGTDGRLSREQMAEVARNDPT
ncbi:hypothetical protein [Rubrobacter aplysinae]|uniref:hypothetical protein n=1 Tax=Rubrobacter aplysinae TaxID=909625 RepID=UPI00128D39A3|nr:hypothetical protein [Rubrobacter aplysinae]